MKLLHQLISAMNDRGTCFIDGRWRPADSGESLDVHDPATGDKITSVALCGGAEARAAIAAAASAFPAWAELPAIERSDMLMRWYSLIVENIDGLASILTREQGKPLKEARSEVRYCADFVRFYAEEARRAYGEIIPAAQKDSRILVLRQPVGVMACITPWNLPSAMITRKAAPALAAGCTVVVKPAEATPLSALALALLAERAGLPAGVLNVVTGDPQSIGKEFCDNATVRKLSFTGSTRTGRLLAAQCAPGIKRLSLELGGHTPLIVFEDADLDVAVQGAIFSKFRHSGQACIGTNRILVHDRVYDEFSRRFGKAVASLKLGNGFEDDVDVGPLITVSAVDRMEAHVTDALDSGARLLAGGERSEKGAHFYRPTALADVTQDMLIAREETFGPVAAVLRFQTEEEAIRIANGTDYGLAAYFYSRDYARAWRVAEKLECGMVGVNSSFLSNENAPFGGVKQSGYGREGSHYGMDEYLELKYLNIELRDPS